MNRKLLTTGLAVIGLTLAAALTPATAALADNVGSMPSGCSATPRTPGLSSTKKVTYGGSTSCVYAQVSFFRLVHNFDGLPDARVAEQSYTGKDNSYSGSTCDNGTATTPYYSEVGWSSSLGTVQRVSKTISLTHC